jgi:cytochrome c biogenesis protein CcmG/thiol:disulfide interchange protein DsbE
MALRELRWTPRGIVGFAMTVLAIGSLLALLWVRLLAASQTAQMAPASPLVGHRAPDFTVTVMNGTPGERIRLSALKGKPVVVNFWASWCEPCQEETPILEAAWQKHQQDGIVFVGIDYEDKPNDALAFLKQYGVSYPVGPDDQNGSIAVAYGVTGAPETAFISRSGIVAQKVGGPLDDGTLERAITALLR